MGNCIITNRQQLIGIDTSNVIATAPSVPYIATQDCWVMMHVNGTGSVSIDEQQVYYFNQDSRASLSSMFPLKRGQSISGPSCVKVYGIKK